MSDFLTSFVTILIAEVGDKSQLIVLAMTAIYGRRQIMAGVGLSAVVSQTMSVGIGAWLGDAFPRQVVLIVGGLAFIGFGLLTLRERDDDDSHAGHGARRGVIAVAATVFIAELGDKTMVATAALAATSSPVAVWLGSVLALIAAAGLALAAGSRLLVHISRERIRWLAAGIFLLWGASLLITAIV
jgi:putative Ca2+/H+ antiporter (TMEM165/GDT1 family)